MISEGLPLLSVGSWAREVMMAVRRAARKKRERRERK
jgi:hypothetical protein